MKNSVVGGIETLSAMESVPTDQKDRPQSDITIEDTIVFVNPYDDVDAQVNIWIVYVFLLKSIFVSIVKTRT